MIEASNPRLREDRGESVLIVDTVTDEGSVPCEQLLTLTVARLAITLVRQFDTRDPHVCYDHAWFDSRATYAHPWHPAMSQLCMVLRSSDPINSVVTTDGVFTSSVMRIGHAAASPCNSRGPTSLRCPMAKMMLDAWKPWA